MSKVSGLPEGERLITDVVWENIEKYRIEQEMTVNKLCTGASFSPSNYSKRLKSKASISMLSVQKFAAVLGVKTLDLIEDWSE